MFQINQIDFLDLTTDKSFAFPLAVFLKQRIGKQVFG